MSLCVQVQSRAFNLTGLYVQVILGTNVGPLFVSTINLNKLQITMRIINMIKIITDRRFLVNEGTDISINFKKTR